MKYLLIIFLLYSLLGSILPSQTPKKKMINTLNKNLKNKDGKKIIRILESTLEETNYSKSEQISNTYIPYTYINEENETTSELSKQLDKKEAPLQIIRFYNFQRKEKQIHFNTLFYFIGRKIAKSLNFNIIINYSKRSNVLKQVSNIESVSSKCDIINNNLIGQDGNENIINYECKAFISKDEEIKRVMINIMRPIKVENKNGTFEIIHFKDINFNGDSAEESYNLQDIKKIELSGILKDAAVKLPVEKDNFKISGILSEEGLLKDNEIIYMSFLDEINGRKTSKIYQCIALKTYPKCEIECNIGNQSQKRFIKNLQLEYNTNNQQITTSIKDLHLSTGITSSNTFLIVKMKNWENNNYTIKTPVVSKDNKIYNKKNSSDAIKVVIAVIIITSIILIVIIFIGAVMLWKKKKNNKVANKNIDISNVANINTSVNINNNK